MKSRGGEKECESERWENTRTGEGGKYSIWNLKVV